MKKRGRYTVLESKAELEAFVKRKRKRRLVLFTGALLPQICKKCEKPITDTAYSWIYPKEKAYASYHYECVWNVIFERIADLSRINQIYAL